MLFPPLISFRKGCAFLTSSTGVKNKSASYVFRTSEEEDLRLKTLPLLLPHANHCLKLCFRVLQIEDRLNEPGVIGAPRALHFAPINCVCRSVKVQGSLTGGEERVQKVCFAHKFPPRFSIFHLLGWTQPLAWVNRYTLRRLVTFCSLESAHLMIKSSIVMWQGKEQLHIGGTGAAKLLQGCVTSTHRRIFYYKTAVGKK